MAILAIFNAICATGQAGRRIRKRKSEVSALLNDFEIITRHFHENNDIKIYPISDVHLGAAEHLAAEWDNFVGLLNYRVIIDFSR